MQAPCASRHRRPSGTAIIAVSAKASMCLITSGVLSARVRSETMPSAARERVMHGLVSGVPWPLIRGSVL
jgi:hypothetical protein